MSSLPLLKMIICLQAWGWPAWQRLTGREQTREYWQSGGNKSRQDTINQNRRTLPSPCPAAAAGRRRSTNPAAVKRSPCNAGENAGSRILRWVSESLICTSYRSLNSINLNYEISETFPKLSEYYWRVQSFHEHAKNLYYHFCIVSYINWFQVFTWLPWWTSFSHVISYIFCRSGDLIELCTLWSLYH